MVIRIWDLGIPESCLANRLLPSHQQSFQVMDRKGSTAKYEIEHHLTVSGVKAQTFTEGCLKKLVGHPWLELMSTLCCIKSGIYPPQSQNPNLGPYSFWSVSWKKEIKICGTQIDGVSMCLWRETEQQSIHLPYVAGPLLAQSLRRRDRGPSHEWLMDLVNNHSPSQLATPLFWWAEPGWSGLRDRQHSAYARQRRNSTNLDRHLHRREQAKKEITFGDFSSWLLIWGLIAKVSNSVSHSFL